MSFTRSSHPTTRRLIVVGLIYVGLASAAWAAEAGGYEAATANDPHFSDRSVWPENLQTDKAAYAKEIWPKGRVLVWANPDAKASKGLNPADPANWLENGKVANEPLDGTCDVIFPTARVSYEVHGKKDPCQVRHITIGAGCSLHEWQIGHSGNTWVKKGGGYAFGSGDCKGGKHTFMRNDNDKPVMGSNGTNVQKANDASVEFIGAGGWGAYDDMMFTSGTCIVGPDSTLLCGDRSNQAVFPGSRLIVMSGGTFTKRAAQPWGADLLIGEGGVVQAGTAERPITRDCFISLSWKPRNRANPPGWERNKILHHFGIQDNGDVSMIVLPEGRIEVHSSEGKKARLVFQLNRKPPDSAKYTEEMVKDLPHKIDVAFLGASVVPPGVEFRDVNQGGIMLKDPSVRAKWTGVTFGDGEGKVDELFAPLGDFKPHIDVQGWDTKKLYKKRSAAMGAACTGAFPAGDLSFRVSEHDDPGLTGAGCFAPLWTETSTDLALPGDTGLTLINNRDGKQVDVAGAGNEVHLTATGSSPRWSRI